MEEKVAKNLEKEREIELQRKEQDQLERMSNASSFYAGLKTIKNVRPKKFGQNVLDPLNKIFGVTNLPSDNMDAIMTNQFQKDFIMKKIQRDGELNQKMKDMRKKFSRSNA